MAFQLDTGSKAFKFGVMWAGFSLILFIVLLFLNKILDTSRIVLFVIALGVSGFATAWLLRNTYGD